MRKYPYVYHVLYSECTIVCVPESTISAMWAYVELGHPAHAHYVTCISQISQAHYTAVALPLLCRTIPSLSADDSCSISDQTEEGELH